MNTDNIGVVFVDPEMDKQLMLEAIHMANDENKVIVIGNSEAERKIALSNSAAFVRSLGEMQIPIVNPCKEMHEDLENKRRRSIEHYIHIDSPKPKAQGSLKLGSYKFKSSRRK